MGVFATMAAGTQTGSPAPSGNGGIFSRLAASQSQQIQPQPLDNPTGVSVAGKPLVGGLLGKIVTGIGGAAKAIYNTAAGGAMNVNTGINTLISPPDVRPQDVSAAYAGGGLPAGVAEAAAQVAKAGAHGVAALGQTVGGVAQAVGSPLFAAASAIGTPIGNAIGNAVPDSSAMQLDKFLQEHPAIGQNATDILNISNLAVPDVVKKVAPTISEAGQAAVDAAAKAHEAIVGTPAQQATARAAAFVQSAADAKAHTAAQVQSVATDWTKPTTINTASFNKARAVLGESPTTPQFIAEHGLNPFTHIEDGKYTTSDTAQQLRDTAGKLSSDSLRPSLNIADNSTPKTPVTDIISATVTDIKSTKGNTPGNIESQIKAAKSEGAALQRKFPNGMSLTDMHDAKITYSSNGKYSPIGDISVNNTAAMNRAFGRTLASTVETKAPVDLSVKDFNAYLAKYYKAADYLDALNGKKAPVSTAQSIARGVARFGGAALARHLLPGGGELVSSFAGYQIGKALEHAVENLTNPMRDSFLRNLKVSNPEAYNKVATFIGQQLAEQATRLRLPAGSPLGSPRNPFIPPAPTTFEPAAQKIFTEPNSQRLLNQTGENPIPLPQGN
jgi:hypothetical protein